MDEMSDNDNLIQTQVDDETNVNDSDDAQLYNDLSDGNWIQWFCQLEGNEFFVEIDGDFFEDSVNLFGLSKINKNYR